MTTITKELTRAELDALLAEEQLEPGGLELVERWIARGDGVAIYRNVLLGHPQLGHRQLVSFGSPAAQLEVDTPPDRMPDIGGSINWRYTLEGYYR